MAFYNHKTAGHATRGWHPRTQTKTKHLLKPPSYGKQWKNTDNTRAALQKSQKIQNQNDSAALL